MAAAQGAPSIAVFSKPLAKRPTNEVARIAKQLAVDAVDLTVRPDGHVTPSAAATDLPRVNDEFANQGLRICMVNTEFTDAHGEGVAETLRTAGRLMIPFFKLGYWPYRDRPIETVLQEVSAAAGELVRLAKQSHIQALWHNHSGDNVGHAFWDAHRITAGWDAAALGYLFDLSHATGEGAVEGWQIALRLALPRTQVVAAKDHTWERVNGRWKRRTCALGQGAVDFPRAMKLLAAGGFRGYFTIDCAYPARDPVDALAADVAFVRSHIQQAYGAMAGASGRLP